MEFQIPSKQYKSKDHYFYSCQYYVIFCTKFRRKVITAEMIDRLRNIFYDIASEYDFEILDMEILPDRVQLMINCDPDLGIASCVKRLKNGSAKMLKDEFPKLKSRLPSLWTRNTFVSSLGTLALTDVNEYIEAQKGK